MANNTLTINKIVSIFRDISIRHEMVNDFGFGPTSNIGAERPMMFPYMWLEPSTVTIQKANQAQTYNSLLVSFDVYVMDKIDKGDLNFEDTLSDTNYILNTIVTEISQHQFYIDMNISTVGDFSMNPVMEDGTDNVNGWKATISLKVPLRYTPCTTPIEPITGWTIALNEGLGEFRITGSSGTSGTSGGSGSSGASGSNGSSGSSGTSGVDGSIGSSGNDGSSGSSGTSGGSGSSGASGSSGTSGTSGSSGTSGTSGSSGTSGTSGSSGSSGTSGSSGSSGSAGTSGSSGTSGSAGTSGLLPAIGLEPQLIFRNDSSTYGYTTSNLLSFTSSTLTTTNIQVNGTFSNYNSLLYDIGLNQNSDLRGYGLEYITDKTLNNVVIGSNGATSSGGLKVTTGGVLQVYLSGGWQTVVSNFIFREDSSYGYTLEHAPIGFTNYIEVMTGQSLNNLGLNGLPITNAYKTSQGAFPLTGVIGGGTI
jgi:hypothetical protein